MLVLDTKKFVFVNEFFSIIRITSSVNVLNSSDVFWVFLLMFKSFLSLRLCQSIRMFIIKSCYFSFVVIVSCYSWVQVLLYNNKTMWIVFLFFSICFIKVIMSILTVKRYLDIWNLLTNATLNKSRRMNFVDTTVVWLSESVVVCHRRSLVKWDYPGFFLIGSKFQYISSFFLLKFKYFCLSTRKSS